MNNRDIAKPYNSPRADFKQAFAGLALFGKKTKTMELLISLNNLYIFVTFLIKQYDLFGVDMGQIKTPAPVKLIVGMLSGAEELFGPILEDMEEFWGKVDISSEIMNFTYTNYYTKQMGQDLLRKFVSFADLIDPGELARIKHQSNDLEEKWDQSSPGKKLGMTRCVNLDPGYVEPSKLVLASTKNYSHRIYIGESIYAECTLHYHKGLWQSWPFTYPDYGSGDYDEFLNNARQKLAEQLSSQKADT